jgi:hypothetical protein
MWPLWGGGGACMVLLGKFEGRGHLEDLCVDGSVILEWILSKLPGRALASPHIALTN